MANTLNGVARVPPEHQQVAVRYPLGHHFIGWLERWIDRRTALERSRLDRIMHEAEQAPASVARPAAEAWWRSWRASKKRRGCR